MTKSNITNSPAYDAKVYRRLHNSINTMFLKSADSGEGWCDLCSETITIERNCHEPDCAVSLVLNDLDTLVAKLRGRYAAEDVEALMEESMKTAQYLECRCHEITLVPQCSSCKQLDRLNAVIAKLKGQK